MTQDFKEIKEMIARERKHGAFIFLPSPILPMKDSFFMPLAETVYLTKEDIYPAQKKFRIHYSGLLKLGAGACVKWGVENTRAIQVSQTYCAFKAVGGVLRADGTIQWHSATKEWDSEVIKDELTEKYSNGWDGAKDLTSWPFKDYGDKSEYVSFMVTRDLLQSRKNKLTNSESGAKARVLRAVLGLQGTYSSESQLIGMPFIMIHYAQNPNHPQVKQMLLQSLAPAQSMIYGERAQQNQISYSDEDVSGQDVIDVEVTEPPDEQPPQAEGFNPPGQEDELTLDIFTSSDIESQIIILKNFCGEVGENFDKYEKDHAESGGLKGLDQIWRNGFFEYLIEQKEKRS